MNYRSLLLITVTMLSGSLGSAQDVRPAVAEDFIPSTLNQPGKQYPQVNGQPREDSI